MLELVREGLPNAEIAIRLGVSVNTVRYHVANLLSKASAKERDEVKRWDAGRGTGAHKWAWWPVLIGGGLAAAVATILVAVAANRWTAEGEAAPRFPKYTLSVFAGSGKFASEDGKGAEASFRDPRGIAVDTDGTVYVLEMWNPCLRRITPDGFVSTIVPSRDPEFGPGTGCAADLLNGSTTLSIAGNTLFGSHNAYVERFTLPSGDFDAVTAQKEDVVSTAQYGPVFFGVVGEPDGSFLILDRDGNRIVSQLHGFQVFAGTGAIGHQDGPALQASFDQPEGMALTPDGGLYVADTLNHTIRYISNTGVVSTVTGSLTPGTDDGPARQATFIAPSALAVDPAGNVWVLDNVARSVRVLSHGVRVHGRHGSSGLQRLPVHCRCARRHRLRHRRRCRPNSQTDEDALSPYRGSRPSFCITFTNTSWSCAPTTPMRSSKMNVGTPLTPTSCAQRRATSTSVR